jgi:hypothetical protein
MRENSDESTFHGPEDRTHYTAGRQQIIVLRFLVERPEILVEHRDIFSGYRGFALGITISDLDT